MHADQRVYFALQRGYRQRISVVHFDGGAVVIRVKNARQPNLVVREDISVAQHWIEIVIDILVPKIVVVDHRYHRKRTGAGAVPHSGIEDIPNIITKTFTSSPQIIAQVKIESPHFDDLFNGLAQIRIHLVYPSGQRACIGREMFPNHHGRLNTGRIAVKRINQLTHKRSREMLDCIHAQAADPHGVHEPFRPVVVGRLRCGVRLFHIKEKVRILLIASHTGKSGAIGFEIQVIHSALSAGHSGVISSRLQRQIANDIHVP